jgi:tryptophan 2,3-dioxygenase
MSTAAALDGALLTTLSAREFRDLRARLLNSDTNISYEARELRALLERQNRFPGMSASTLVHSPAAMALIITEYRSGRRSTSIEESRIGANAVRTLNLLQGSMLTQFLDSENDPKRIRADVKEYLENISCESGMFNRACERNSGIKPSRLQNPDTGR